MHIQEKNHIFCVSTLVLFLFLTCTFHSLLGTKEDLRKTSLAHTNDNTDTKTSNSIPKKSEPHYLRWYTHDEWIWYFSCLNDFMCIKGRSMVHWGKNSFVEEYLRREEEIHGGQKIPEHSQHLYPMYVKQKNYTVQKIEEKKEKKEKKIEGQTCAHRNAVLTGFLHQESCVAIHTNPLCTEWKSRLCTGDEFQCTQRGKSRCVWRKICTVFGRTELKAKPWCLDNVSLMFPL